MVATSAARSILNYAIDSLCIRLINFDIADLSRIYWSGNHTLPQEKLMESPEELLRRHAKTWLCNPSGGAGRRRRVLGDDFRAPQLGAQSPAKYFPQHQQRRRPPGHSSPQRASTPHRLGVLKKFKIEPNTANWSQSASTTSTPTPIHTLMLPPRSIFDLLMQSRTNTSKWTAASWNQDAEKLRGVSGD